MPGCVVKVVKTRKGGMWRHRNYLTIESERYVKRELLDCLLACLFVFVL
jgi:hypothetical protein